MKLEGISIREVWDYRLSRAIPIISRKSGFWVVEIRSKSNPDFDPSNPDSISEPLEVFDTKIPVMNNDEYDTVKVIKCYEWLKTVRDNYSLPDIEERKPLVATINAANAALAALGEI